MSTFIIRHEGLEGITDHMKTRRHKYATKHQHSTSTVCSDVKTVSKNDHLINATTEDKFIDCFVAHDFHLNHVTALHWICSLFYCKLCNQDSCACTKSQERTASVSALLKNEENCKGWKDSSFISVSSDVLSRI